MRGLVALIMIVPLVAGCLSGPVEDLGAEAVSTPVAPGYVPPEGVLSEDVYDVLDAVRGWVGSSVDGIRLHAQVHLPDGEGPWPTILQLSPYHSHPPEALKEFLGEPGASLVERYVPKGYAVVMADVRGTGNSEGCLEMMGSLERQDAHDIVEWIASQPWSDGKVGMQGVSYVGTTPHEALVMAPEHLVTVVTVAGVTNQWRNTFQNGVPYQGRFYPITYNLYGAQPPTNVDEPTSWAPNTAGAACGQQEAVAAMSPGTYEKGVYDAYWVDRNQTLFVDQANAGNASILYSQGFVDRAVNPSEAVHWFNELTIPKKGLFHQAGHQYAPREDYFDMELAWFDHWLKGIDTGIMDTPQVEVQLNDGTIRTGETWPSKADEVDMLRLYLAPDGLVPDRPADATLTYTAAQALNAQPLSGGPVDTAYDAVLGTTSLTFSSTPLEAPVHVAGSAWMHLLGSVDAENTYWLFDMYDVAPDGSRTWIAEGWMNAHLHDGFDHSTPLVPGEPTPFDFRFEPREYVFADGHQIVLELNGHDSGVLPFDQPMTTNTVHIGPSYVELPLLTDPMVWEAPEAV